MLAGLSLRCKLLEVVADDFLFYLVPFLFVFQEIWVEHELVQRLLGLQLHVQFCLVSDLVSFFNQIQFLLDAWKGSEFVFTNLEKFLDDVLDAFADVSVVENSTETLENSVCASLSNLRKHLSTLLHKFSGQLNRVFSRLRQKKAQQF